MAQATKKTTTNGATVHMVAAGTMPAATATATASVNPMLAMIAAMTATASDATATEDDATATAAPLVDPMAGARDAFATGMGSTDLQQQGFANTYADLMNRFLPEGWFNIKPASDKSDEGKRVRREQKACYAALNAAKHSNPSMAWNRVCKAGLTLAVGAMSAEDKAEAVAEAEANKKTMYQKVQASLAAIVTKLADADADHKAEIDALALIIKALPIK
jgi:hypothetical protein